MFKKCEERVFTRLPASISFEVPLLSALDSLAAAERRSRSSLVNEAVEEWLDAHRRLGESADRRDSISRRRVITEEM